MRALHIALLIVGIILLVIGMAFLGLGMLSQEATTMDETKTVPAYATYGMARSVAAGDHIEVDFKAKPAITRVYISDSRTSDMFGSLYTVKKLLAENSSGGHHKYKVEDSGTHYLVFENMGAAPVKLSYNVNFGSETGQNLCLVPGIATLLGGIICIVLVIVSHRKAKAASMTHPQVAKPGYPQQQQIQPQQPHPGYQQQPQYQQPGYDPQAQAPTYPQAGTDQHQSQPAYQQPYQQPPPPPKPGKEFKTYVWDQDQ